MDDQTVLADCDQFDEVAYLRLYPDIAKAVAAGRAQIAVKQGDGRYHSEPLP